MHWKYKVYGTIAVGIATLATTTIGGAALAVYLGVKGYDYFQDHSVRDLIGDTALKLHKAQDLYDDSNRKIEEAEDILKESEPETRARELEERLREKEAKLFESLQDRL